MRNFNISYLLNSSYVRNEYNVLWVKLEIILTEM